MEVNISDKEWAFIYNHLSKLPPPEHPGRPRANDRDLFEGILWIMVTGSQWRELPKKYPAKSSCHRRFQTWAKDGSFIELRKSLIRRMKLKRRLNLKESFVDGTLITAKKRGRIPGTRDFVEVNAPHG